MLRRRITLLRRHADLSRAQFDDHWALVHAPLVKQLPGIDAYVQHSVVRSTSRGVDGIAEVWFDDAGGDRVGASHTSTAQLLDELAFLEAHTGVTLTVADDDTSDSWRLWSLDDPRMLDLNPPAARHSRWHRDPTEPIITRQALATFSPPDTLETASYDNAKEAGDAFDELVRTGSAFPPTDILLTSPRRVV